MHEGHFAGADTGPSGELLTTNSSVRASRRLWRNFAATALLCMLVSVGRRHHHIQPSSVAVCAGWCGQRHTRVFVRRAVVRCFAFASSVVSVGRWHHLRVSVFVCPRERAREKERDSRNSILIIAMLRHDVVIPNSMYDATSSSSSPTQCMMPCHRRHPLLNVRFHNIVVIPYSMYDATSSSSSPR